MSQMERYTIRDSNNNPVSFTAKTPELLILAIQRYRRGENSTITDDETSKEVSSANGYVHVDGRYSKVLPERFDKVNLSLAAVTSGCKALVENIKNNVVDSAEFNRRWSICLGCPAKTNISDCMACGAAGRVANWVQRIKVFARKNLPITTSIGSSFCGLCGCSHALLLPTKMEYQKAESESTNSKRPDQCWLKTGGKNYKP